MRSNISPLGVTNAGMTSSVQTHTTQTDDAIVVIAFKFGGDELSVVVEDATTLDSSMEEVMEEGYIFNEFNKESQFKIQILTKSGHKITFKWKKFRMMTVKQFISLKCIDEDYIVFIVFN